MVVCEQYMQVRICRQTNIIVLHVYSLCEFYCLNGTFIVFKFCLKDKGTMHKMTKNNNRALMHDYVLVH